MQQSFFEAFEEAAFEQKTIHMPAAMEQALPYFERLLDRFNSAILNADLKTAGELVDEAGDLVLKLNNGDPGILSSENSPGCVLERKTAEPEGVAPRWGRTGSFVTDISGVKTRIEMEGIFGLAADPLPGFVIRAVEFEKPFFTETGYRSFLGVRVAPEPGMTTKAFSEAVIGVWIKQRKGKALSAIEPRYRQPECQNTLLP